MKTVPITNMLLAAAIHKQAVIGLRVLPQLVRKHHVLDSQLNLLA
jgi:hypothetical protein